MKGWNHDSSTGPPLTIPKAGLYPKMLMLSMWWNWKGAFYYEIHP